tara:strand:+ start:295 stop:591 length:297 start_codon:yes stop_codon:yes gene_type:complete
MNSVYGWIASIITLIYKLPQIYKIIVTKKSSDISIISYFVQSIGYIFYILHGIQQKDNPIILMGGGALCQSLILMILYFIYKNNDKVNDINEQDDIII